MTGRSARLQERDARMAALADDGFTLRQIADAVGVDYAVVVQWKRLSGATVAKGKSGAAAGIRDMGRAEKMAAMYRQGVTLQKIGDQFGLTRERVRQLLRKQGVDGASGGQYVQVIAKRTAKKTRQNARWLAKYALPYEVVRQLQADGVTAAFIRQRANAARRGIAWGLEFTEWLAIWQASGKLHLRGRGKGAYVMSRIKDSGGYEIGNVHIQSAVENSREAVEKWRGKTKTHRGVFCLCPGREKAFLATVNRVRIGFFSTEAEAVAAQAAYRAEHNLPVAVGALGSGRGWTFVPTLKARPYFMQCCGVKSYHATPAEAEAAYEAAVAARRSELSSKEAA